MTLWVDLETRSRIDLAKTGVYRYVTCPDFRILMASWSNDGDTIQTALEQEEISDIPGLWDPKVEKVAHNAQFDRIALSAFWGIRYLDPEPWKDTQAIAGELGFPQSLQKLAVALGAAEKDKAGTRLINLFSKPNRSGEWNGPTTHPLQWLDFITYCEQDVATLIEVDRLLGGWPTEMERQVFLADQRINDRGITIDVPLARVAARVGSVNQAEQKQKVRELTGVNNPGSPIQMKEWAKKEGLGLPNLRAETVEAALGTDLTPTQREVLELRQELALAAPAKYTRAVDSQVGGRLRGTFKFFGAHTGRWAGRGTQLQNLPRETFETDRETEFAIWELMNGFGASAETLKKLVRPLFLGPFTVVDYKSIEALVIAWLAGEGWAVEAFRSGRDIYLETAQRMGGLSRSQGKVAVLALGFGGGASSLKAMAGDNDCLPPRPGPNGEDQKRNPPGIEVNEEESKRILDASDDELLQRFVYPWREANANIVRLWKTMEKRFRTGGSVGQHLYFENRGIDRLLRLPSGRAICYRESGPDKEGGLEFRSPLGYPQGTWGGKLAENATQAVARDVLAEALVRLESRGYRVVGHIHDEIIIEGEHDVGTVTKIMTEPLAWAEDMPIGGEGFVCNRYKK